MNTHQFFFFNNKIMPNYCLQVVHWW